MATLFQSIPSASQDVTARAAGFSVRGFGSFALKPFRGADTAPSFPSHPLAIAAGLRALRWGAGRRRLCPRIRAQRETPMSENIQDFNFLQGVKVVDFTQFEAGTTSTEVLAWFGAEVVKIENPGRGDPGRRLRPGKPDDDPWYFHQFNVNKKSLAINLKSPRGLEIVKEMLKKADVTVENMAPGTIERLGLDYESVKKINPGIIYCQIKGFGTGSPHEAELAFDMIAQAAGRPISVTRGGHPPPVQPGPTLGRTHPGMASEDTD